MNGWIGMPRALIDDAWYRDAPPFARALYFHLAMRANFGPSTTRKGLTLRAGQLVTSWANLADEMAGVENRRRVTPTLWKVRHTAGLLAEAGLISWTTAPTSAGGGIIVTLEWWAMHADASETTADTTPEQPQTPLRKFPQHSNNTTGACGSAGPKTMKERIAEWEREEREGWEAH